MVRTNVIHIATHCSICTEVSLDSKMINLYQPLWAEDSVAEC